MKIGNYYVWFANLNGLTELHLTFSPLGYYRVRATLRVESSASLIASLA